MKLISWKSYYRDEQILEYNLSNYKDNDTEIRLFNTNDTNMEGDNQINYLNPYLGELPMMYYIWKNNIKSDYIEISQYRRHFSYIDYNELNKDKIQLWCQWHENYGVKLKDRLLTKRDPTGEIKNILWKFLKNHYKLSSETLTEIQNKTSYHCMAGFIWVMNWNTYCKLCELIFGFLDALFPNEGWKNIDTILNFRNNEKKLYKEKYGEDDEWVFDNNRYLVYIIEDTLSVILSSFFKLFGNNKYWDETYIITEVNKSNTIFDIAKFYKLNLKCNPFHIYIKCMDENSYNEFYEFFMVVDNWEFNRIQIIKDNEAYDKRAMQLNINEYIDLKQPIDLQENKYDIKKIL